MTDSTNIAAIGYARDSMALRVRFRDGSEYEYEAVGVKQFVNLMNAPSIGEYFATHIRGHYKTWRLNKPRARARTS
ncbi:MAG TPA: KTSC domain-containing protein [Casimicrobiaceae bacterium]|nr:KTSC domain-containing protein [Casimicrobiaceae bacterium]